MILRNEFTVRSDLETVWARMLELESVANCVPGARIEKIVPPNGYEGTIRVRIGPMIVDYTGQATLLDVDEEARTATILLKAREARGQGSAVAVVRNHLEETSDGTRVMIETDLQITGPQALFGKGVLEDVGSRVLEEFSRRLEDGIAAKAHGVVSGADLGVDGAGDSFRVDSQHGVGDEAFDLGRMVARSMLDRTAKVAAVVVALGMVLALGRRGGTRRRDFRSLGNPNEVRARK